MTKQQVEVLTGHISRLPDLIETEDFSDYMILKRNEIKEKIIIFFIASHSQMPRTRGVRLGFKIFCPFQ